MDSFNIWFYSQVKGALQSNTLLPMPAGIERIYVALAQYIESGGEEIDLPLKSSVEGAVIRWASIVGDILKQASTLAFAGGAHPTPRSEVQFWKARLKNLECIYDQLRDPRVKKMVLYLEKTDSSYLPCFKVMFKNVVASVVEGRDICLYLKAFEPHFSVFEDNEFLEARDNIKPLVHCVGLLWANSRYYCSSDKIVILLKEIANLLIEAVSRDLDPSSIFQGEADETYEKLKKCIEQLELFQTAFEHVRANIHTYFKEDVEPMPWTFHSRNAFQRLIDFLDRLRLVSSIVFAGLEFNKLEKVEIGGLRGRLLSQKCQEVFEEFKTHYSVFANIQYDILYPEDHEIDTDYEKFCEQCDDLDRRLAAIFEQAFDECYNLEAVFKFLNVMGTLYERPIIHAQVSKKIDIIKEMFDGELNVIKIIYDDAKKYGAPIDKYFPPVAGSLLWLIKLKKRLTAHSDDYKEHELPETEETNHVFEKMDEMLRLIEADERRIFEDWCVTVPRLIEASLNRTYVLRDNNGLLELNVDDAMIATLREMRYMRDLEDDLEEVVPEAMALYKRNEELTTVVMRLNRIVEWYNYVKTKTLPVEFDLIKVEVDDLDVIMEAIVSELTWTTDSKYALHVNCANLSHVSYILLAN